MTEGEFAGCVSCNEMILFKIEEELFQEIMKYLHHDLPMGEEELLKANTVIEQEDSKGTQLGQREGFTSLARKVANPTFQS